MLARADDVDAAAYNVNGQPVVLDLLPFKRPSGRLRGRWGWLRYLHFALSLTLVLLLVFIVGFRGGATGKAAVVWFIAGNLPSSSSFNPRIAG